MGEMYATITSKGQVTLPARARRALGLRPGQRVVVRVEGDSLILDAPPSLDRLRAQIREEALAQGTWDRIPSAGEGWVAQAEDHRGEH
ncbi:MAG: AbrB/MazE/SpoVT family DNA-binding domain-containing protein [Pauljensenia sp.]